jgi:arylsulfatase A-like enzyme
MTDLILDFWKQNPDVPWLTTAAYIIPHLPFVCDETYMVPFLEKGLSQDLALCYGSIAQLDAAIGRLLDGLKESGQTENTIVVLVSDNGMSHKTNSGQEYSEKDWAIRDFHKLRGEKATAWENGIYVPCLVRWPGRITPGKRPQLGAAEDLLPTMLDLAGVSPDAIRHFPLTGVSLRPVLDNAAAEMQHPDLFRMAISGPGSPRDLASGQQRKFEDHHLTLRGLRFKYHALPGGTCALYDLVADPGESVDVQGKFPEVTAGMAKEICNRWDALVAENRCFIPVADTGKKKK